MQLTIGEQHRLGFARLLLAKPSWVISDNALDLLDEEFSEGLLSIFDRELAGTAVLSLAPRQSASGFYQRIVNLVGPERPHKRWQAKDTFLGAGRSSLRNSLAPPDSRGAIPLG